MPQAELRHLISSSLALIPFLPNLGTLKSTDLNLSLLITVIAMRPCRCS
jgi:hypothetical protein